MADLKELSYESAVNRQQSKMQYGVHKYHTIKINSKKIVREACS